MFLFHVFGPGMICRLIADLLFCDIRDASVCLESKERKEGGRW